MNFLSPKAFAEDLLNVFNARNKAQGYTYSAESVHEALDESEVWMVRGELVSNGAPIEIVESVFGDEGDYNKDVRIIFKVGEQYFRFTGHYASWVGTEWDSEIPEEVEIAEQVVNVFKTVEREYPEEVEPVSKDLSPERMTELLKKKYTDKYGEEDFSTIISESSWYLDKPTEIDGVTVQVVENHGGGEGEGERRFVVFKADDRYFRYDGYYSSWDGSTFDDETPREVFPKTKEVVFYE